MVHTLICLLALLSVPAACAAAEPVPVRLPMGESEALWAPTLELADMAPGQVGIDVWVELVGGDEHWLLRVHDAQGQQRELQVSPPTSEADREDLVWLAASLLRVPGGAVEQPQPKSVEPPVRVEPPAPAEPEPPSPPPPPPVAAVSHDADADPVVLSPPARAGSMVPWASLELVAAGRPQTGLRWSPGVSGGLLFSQEQLRLGLGLAIGSLEEPEGLGLERGFRSLESGVLASWLPLSGAVHPVLGASLRLSLRSWQQSQQTTSRVLIPVAMLNAGANWRVRPRLDLEAGLQVEGDLRRTEILVGERSENPPSRVVVGVSVAFFIKGMGEN